MKTFLVSGAVAVGVVWATVAACAHADDFDVTAHPLDADPRVQEVLKRLVPPVEAESVLTRNLEILRLESTQELIRQLVWFAAKASGMEEAMLPGVVIEQLKIRRARIPVALADYLETPDPQLRKQMKNWLGGNEAEYREGPPNFSSYEEIIRSRRAQKQPLPAGLIRHMYDVDPQQALFSLMRVEDKVDVEKNKQLEWADHRVQEVFWRQDHQIDVDAATEIAAKDALSEMAGSGYWWARLYTAEILERQPTLRSEELLKKLANDDNVLVRKAIGDQAK